MFELKKVSIAFIVISFFLFLLSITGWAETEPSIGLKKPNIHIYPENSVLNVHEPFNLRIELENYNGALQDLNIQVNGEKAETFFHQQPILVQTKNNTVLYILRQVQIDKPGEISVDADFLIDGKSMTKKVDYQAK